MAKSAHHLWQKRWKLEDETATHDTGLVCRLGPAGVLADNPRDVQAALSEKNGHNAAMMVGRLIREAEAIFHAGSTFKARLPK